MGYLVDINIFLLLPYSRILPLQEYRVSKINPNPQNYSQNNSQKLTRIFGSFRIYVLELTRIRASEEILSGN